MAFADLGSLGAVGATSNNQTTLDLVTTAAIAAGELVVVVVAADNIANGGDDNACSGVTLGVGGQALTKGKQIATALAAQAGASCSLWYGVATSGLASGGTIRATFGSATLVDASGMTARHFSVGAATTIAIEGTPGTLVGNTAADPGSLDVTTANIHTLCIRGIASQVGNNTNLTPTASWTAWANGNSATTGTTGEMCARAEHRILTSTTAPSNPTYVSAIYASVYVAFREDTVPATGTGTPTAQDAVVASPGISASSGTATLGLGVSGSTLDLDFAAGTITEGVLAPVNFAVLAGVGEAAYTGTGVLPRSGATLDLNFAADTIVEGGAPYVATVAGVGEVTTPALAGIGVLVAEPAVLAGVGVSVSSGTAAATAQDATAAGAGVSASIGTGALAEGVATVAGVGVSRSFGTGTLAVQAATVAGAGVSAATGTGILAAQVATVAATGLSASSGTAALAAAAATAAGLGTVAFLPVTGTGTLAATASAVAGIGAVIGEEVTGTGTPMATNATVSGAGLSQSTGTGAAPAAAATLAAIGEAAYSGTGALAAGAAIAAGAGLSGSIGIATLVAQTAAITGEGTGATLVYLRPDGDSDLDGWTDQAGGTSNIVASIDEASASDADYVQSPEVVGTVADLKVRLFDGVTQIVEWTHTDIADEFTDAAQTLTTPQVEAIGDFANLSVELDDNAGNVYRFSLGDPPGRVAEPVVVRYRYKKLAA